ncbi:MAG: hypothetical protein AW07_01152 [Candidatus Accumulibacter sp. SK-11]|nr:MAG: hypothetical protein AW07_01152 [Candidatus Accumulibacter sp. SK-11]
MGRGCMRPGYPRQREPPRNVRRPVILRAVPPTPAAAALAAQPTITLKFSGRLPLVDACRPSSPTSNHSQPH